MITTIYFVRHAEPNYANHDDFTRELSEKGLRDRVLVTEFFRGRSVDTVLSSPYKRAYDTVLPLAEERGLSIVTDADFRERRVDSGWIEDFTAFSKQQWADFSYKLSDGECLAEVQKRNIAALIRVLREYTGKTVVIGSHGTALSTVIHYYDAGFGYADFEKLRPLMPLIVRFDFEGERCTGMQQYNLFA